MRCEEVQDVLESGAAARPGVGEHLGSCTMCQEFSRDLDISLSAFKAISVERLSTEASSALRARVGDLARRQRMRVRPPAWWAPVYDLLRQRRAPAFALAGVALVALVFVMWPSSPPSIAVIPRVTQGQGPVVASTVEAHVVDGEILRRGVAVGPGAGPPARLSVGPGADDRLEVRPGGSAVIALAGGTRMALTGDSAVRLGTGHVWLERGEARLSVPRGQAGLTVAGARLVARVMGTRFTVAGQRVETIEGRVEVRSQGGGERVTVGERQVATLGPAGTLVKAALSSDRLGELVRGFATMEGGLSGLAADLGQTEDELRSRLWPRPTPATSLPPATTRPAIAATVSPSPAGASPSADADNPIDALAAPRR